jgi:hypothetical protein
MTNSQDSSRRDSMKAVQYKVPGNAFSVAATVLLHYGLNQDGKIPSELSASPGGLNEKSLNRTTYRSSALSRCSLV